MQNDDLLFKAAVGKFPTGVTVISANHANQLVGFTANSFTSVSLNPQLVSFCLNKEAGSFKALSLEQYFAVNILADDQEEISQNFASRKENKFKDIEYELSKLSSAPIISGSISSLECKKYDQIDCGDHDIFIGEVINITINEEKSPLLYFARSYMKISR